MYPLVEVVLGITFIKAVCHIGFSLCMEGYDHTMYGFIYHLFKISCK